MPFDRPARRGGEVKRVRIVGLVLAAIMVIVAVAASLAFATEEELTPEVGVCFAKKKGGHFTDAACGTAAEGKRKGKFEWAAGGSCYEIGKHGNFTEEHCATVAEKKGKPDHKGRWEEAAKAPVLKYFDQVPAALGGGRCPAEFTVKGEKCIFYWRTLAGEEKIKNVFIRANNAPVPLTMIAFRIIPGRNTCNGAKIGAAAPALNCEVEVEFLQPPEPPKAKGKTNELVVEPEAARQLEVVRLTGEW
jgi:hypothetical protein